MTRRRHLLQSLSALAGALGLDALGALAAPAAGAKKVALVVGNANYAGPEKLKNPVADAKLTAENLRRLGFQTQLATDRSAAQLGGDLQAFGQMAQDADIALFFYAGHGIAVENINYLLPVDQKLATATSLDMKRQGISLRAIETLLRQRNARVALIVVDACRNTLMRGAPQQGMALQPRAASGTLTLFSTAPGALARDGTGSNSEFSSVFNRHLANPELSFKQIVEATQRDVSAETGDTQIPWVNSGLVGDIRLAAAQKSEAGPTAKPAPPGGRNRGGGGASEPRVPPRSFWNENLAQLDEQVQFAVLNFDSNSQPLLEQRAGTGDVLALTILGSVYSPAHRPWRDGAARGQNPRARAVAADAARAMRYLAKAADRRFPVAQTLLAELLVEAPQGVARDLQRAENLLQDAAATGYGRARMNLLDLKMRSGSVRAEDLMEQGKTIEQFLERLRPPGP